jgi:hypothetical protein
MTIRKTHLGLSAGALFFLLGGAPAEARTCSDELRACKGRCGNEHGFVAMKLDYCRSVQCVNEFTYCKQTGKWRIRRTGTVKSGLQRK